MKAISISIPLAAVVLLMFGGCAGSDGTSSDEASAETTRAIRVETLVLDAQEFDDVIEVTGAVEAFEDAELSAQAGGSVMTLAPLGAFVRQGQVVAQLDPRIAEASVRQARAQVESAEASYELSADNLRRNEPLYQDSIISALEFENVRAQESQARANLAQAEAGLAQAQEQLRNTRVVAPFSGTVEEHFVRRGEQVTPGMPVARVVSSGRVKVTAGVPERYAGDVTRGTPVSVNLNAYGGASRLAAAVTFVGGTIDPQSRTFPIEVEIPNPEGRIKPEMVATLYVTRAQLEGVLVAPRPALIRDETGFIVYLVDRSGDVPRAQRQSVVLGAAHANEVVLEAGAAPGDEIVVMGQNNVSGGDALEIEEVHDRVEDAVDPIGNELEELPPA